MKKCKRQDAAMNSTTRVTTRSQSRKKTTAINSTTRVTTRSQSRKKATAMTTQKLYEIIDLESDQQNDTLFISQPPKTGSTKSNAISVESYAAADDDDEDIKVIGFKLPLKKPFLSGPSVTEVGESSTSSASSRFECEICADEKPRSEAFAAGDCGHSYCADCTARYVAAKLEDNVTAISCPAPGCATALEPELCRAILPGEVFERWGMALCEALVLSSGKAFYCPFKDCSVAMLDDGGGCGGEVVVEASCPSCHRMFCARCRVAWHAGIGCEEFQRLGKDERASEDLMLMSLATAHQWKRCPSCKFFVERSEGCLYMKCRCGIAFCYNCGNVYTEHNTHFCTKCGKTWS